MLVGVVPWKEEGRKGRRREEERNSLEARRRRRTDGTLYVTIPSYFDFILDPLH